MPTFQHPRTKYLLVCRDTSDNEHRQLSRAEMGVLLHEWLAWHDSLESDGCLCFCSAVEEESFPISRRLSPVGSVRGEQREPVVGYLLVQVGSLEEATEVARGCPGLNRGFTVEIYPPLIEP